MKPMEIVSDYPIPERDNLRRIEKTKEPSEDAKKQQELATGPFTDPKGLKHIQVMTDCHRNTLQQSKGSS